MLISCDVRNRPVTDWGPRVGRGGRGGPRVGGGLGDFGHTVLVVDVGVAKGHERTESSCVGAATATNRPPHCWTSQQTNKLRVSASEHSLYCYKPPCCTYYYHSRGPRTYTSPHRLNRFALHFAPTPGQSLLRSLRMEALFLTSDQTAPIFLRFRKRYAEVVSYLACLLVSYNNAMNISIKFAIELVYIKT